MEQISKFLDIDLEFAIILGRDVIHRKEGL